MTLSERVGAQMRRLRKARSLSQVVLARRTRLGRITVVRIEAGTQDPTLSTLAALATALGHAAPTAEVRRTVA
jgi:transcriptional regulator with XRE-family HTH domain